MKKILVIFLVLLIGNKLFAQDNNSNSQTLMNMIALNAISVTIGGEYIVNGTFPASSTERVDQFVTQLYNSSRAGLLSATKDAKTFTQIQKDIADYAIRGIKLIHSNGTTQIIDLQKFRLTADFDQNPYLKNGDVLIFPAYDIKRNFIAVEGAVNKKLNFQFVDGDKLSDALLFARGINNAYKNVTTAEITRLSYDGKSENIIKVDVNADFTLKVGDRIRVLADDTQRKDYRVLVLGEVYKPGYIYISKNNTMIQEVIMQAGGFRPDADLNRAEVIRNSSELKSGNYIVDKIFDQRSDFLLMQRMSELAIEDSLTFITDNTIRFTRSSAAVDFTRVLDTNSASSKFLVRDRDIIYIPLKSNQIYIYGQVMSPGYIEYRKGENYSYYLSKVGGLGKTAKNDVYLIKGKTRAWINVTDTDNYNIEPGDFMWVPKDIPRNFDYYLTRTARVAGVIGAVATLVLLFKR